MAAFCRHQRIYALPQRSIFAFCARAVGHKNGTTCRCFWCFIKSFALGRSKIRTIGTHSSHLFRFYTDRQSWIIQLHSNKKHLRRLIRACTSKYAQVLLLIQIAQMHYKQPHPSAALPPSPAEKAYINQKASLSRDCIYNQGQESLPLLAKCSLKTVSEE